jgi:hypothetical protein
MSNTSRTLLFDGDQNTLAQRNGTSAQIFRLYNTFTAEDNYERIKFSWESNRFLIGSEAATGTKRPIAFSFGTLTQDTPLSIEQTWNNAATAFTALKIDVTNTASAGGSNLLTCLAGGLPKFRLSYSSAASAGCILHLAPNEAYSPTLLGSNNAIYWGNGGSHVGVLKGNGYLQFASLGRISWSISPTESDTTQDLFILRDAAGILAQRNDTAAQAFRLYGTWTDATNYQRLGVISAKQALTAASGATVATTTLSIPKYSHLIGVTTRVTTALGETNGTTGYTVGDGTDPDLWGAVTGVAIGTTTAAPDYTAVDALGPDGSDRMVTLTAVGGNFDGTGVIDVCAFYLRAEAD